MNYEDAEGMRTWANMEKQTGYGTENIIEICNAVINGRNYTAFVRAEFHSRMGAAYFHKARGERVSNLADAFEFSQNALKCHARAYGIFSSMPNVSLERAHYLCRNTAFQLVDFAVQLGFDKVLIDAISELRRERNFEYDPLVEPLNVFLNYISRTHERSTLQRRKNLLVNLRKSIQTEKNFAFSLPGNADLLLSNIEKILVTIELRLSTARKR